VVTLRTMHSDRMTEARDDSERTLAHTVRVFFGFASPRILATTAAAAWAVRMWAGEWLAADALVATGICVLWPLQEWLIHVYILHFEPFTMVGRTIDLMTAREHRKHHRDPWNLRLVFIPTPVFFYAIPAVCVGWWLAMPASGLAVTGVAVYFTLALHYEWAHYLAHSRYVPRSPHYQRIVRNHRLHHFKNERYWYGVSMISADRLLRTRPDLGRSTAA
jgi:hypothetical protein